MEFTEEHKKQIEKEIVDICINALEKNILTEEQMGDVSFFVLERIDLVRTQAELIRFLEKLTSKWKMFGSILEIQKGKMETIEDKNTVKDVEKLIKDGNIEQAIAIAKIANKGGGI